MKQKISSPFLGFLQTTALVIYIMLISSFFSFVAPRFSANDAQFYAPIIMLLLFVFSAVISAVLVLAKAGVLFWEKKYKESFTLLGWTVGWGIFYFVFFMFLLAIK